MKNSVFNLFFLFVISLLINSCNKEPPIPASLASLPDKQIPPPPPSPPPPPVVSSAPGIFFDTVLVYSDIVKDSGFYRGFTVHTFQIPAIDTINTSHLKVLWSINNSEYFELKNNHSDYSYQKEGSTLIVFIFVLFSGPVTVHIEVKAFH